jgi:hypothetical protein
MEYYLVNGTVSKTPYMGKEERFQDTKLVKATSAEEAKQKFEDYWEGQTNEYSVYYYAYVYAEETIL